MPEPKTHYAYILICNDQSFYTGYTTDLQRRLEEHQQGKNCRYTTPRRPVILLKHWTFPTRSEATKAESAIKKLTHSQKQNLIDGKLSLQLQDNKINFSEIP